jgi:hypothetical protein
MTSDHLGQIGPGPTNYLPGPGYGFGIGSTNSASTSRLSAAPLA